MESNNGRETPEKKIPRNLTKDIVQANAKGTIESLPEEITLYIFSKLGLSSIPQFKYVNKDWYRIFGDPNLTDLCKDRPDEMNQCLIFQSDHPVENEISMVEFDAVYDNEDTNVMTFRSPLPTPMIELIEVICSFNGLLCLSDKLNFGIYLYNPFTMEYKELPKPTRSVEHDYEMVGFGFHPKTKEYKVVKIYYYWIPGPRNVLPSLLGFEMGLCRPQVQVFSLRTSSWRSLDGSPLDHFLDGNSPQVLNDGRLHWLSMENNEASRKIISFDLADEKFRTVPKPRALVLDYCDYVLSLNGCLSAVSCGNASDGNLDVWVMKEYGVENSWVKDFTIAGYVPDVLKSYEQSLDFDEFGEGPVSVSKVIRNGHCNRIVCVLRNGETLIHCKGSALVIYDPKTQSYKDVEFKGMQEWFNMVVHVANFNRMRTILGN